MFPLLFRIPNTDSLSTEIRIVEVVIGVICLLSWLALRSRKSSGWALTTASTGAILVVLHFALSFFMGDEPIKIYSFGVVVVAAFLAATRFMTTQTDKLGLPAQKIFDWGFWLLVTGIVGSRLLYAFLKYEEFEHNKLEIFRIWNGGLVWYGGLIPAVIVAILLLRKYKLPVLTTSDICSSALMLALGIGRWACLLAGDDYGSRTDAWMGIRFHNKDALVPEALKGELLHPTQLYMSLNALWLFVVLEFIRRRSRHAGYTFASMLILYAISRAAFIEPFRGDFVERNPSYGKYAAVKVRVDRDEEEGAALTLPRGTAVNSASGVTGQLLEDLVLEAGSKTGVAWAITDGPATKRKQGLGFPGAGPRPAPWPVSRIDGAPASARISSFELRPYNSDLPRPPGYFSTSQWISIGIIAAGIALFLIARRRKEPGFTEAVEIAQEEKAAEDSAPPA